MAHSIYNKITDVNHSIDWRGFELWVYKYGIKNVGDFMDYMAIIKETISNFDYIYDSKINTPEVKAMQALIDSAKKKAKK